MSVMRFSFTMQMFLLTFLLWDFHRHNLFFEHTLTGRFLTERVAPDSILILLFTSNGILSGRVFCTIALIRKGSTALLKLAALLLVSKNNCSSIMSINSNITSTPLSASTAQLSCSQTFNSITRIHCKSAVRKGENINNRITIKKTFKIIISRNSIIGLHDSLHYRRSNHFVKISVLQQVYNCQNRYWL